MFREQQRHQVDLDTARAWEIANFVRAKRLPNLKTYLEKRGREIGDKPKVQTPQQMKHVLMAYGMKGKPASDDTKKSLKYIKVN